MTTKKPWAIDPDYFEPVSQPLYLIDMSVDPICQRQGLGGLLLEEAKQVARAWPAGAIRLDAYEGHGTDRFYTKCGFKEVGRVVYRDVPLVYFEMLLMKKNLRSPFVVPKLGSFDMTSGIYKWVGLFVVLESFAALPLFAQNATLVNRPPDPHGSPRPARNARGSR